MRKVAVAVDALPLVKFRPSAPLHPLKRCPASGASAVMVILSPATVSVRSAVPPATVTVCFFDSKEYVNVVAFLMVAAAGSESHAPPV